MPSLRVIFAFLASAVQLINAMPTQPTEPKVPIMFPAGAMVKTCMMPNTIALTFDDGPGPYTEELLDQLNDLNVKATFFINGKNYGDLDDPKSAATVKRMYDEGHQIASHTYSHANLTNLEPDEIRDEILRLDEKLKNIIGVHPTYMRPPYGDVDEKVHKVMRELGYRIIIWDIDTNDWRTPESAEESIAAVREAIQRLGAGSRGIVLAHDTIKATAQDFLKPAVEIIRAAGYKLVRLDECMGDPDGAYA
jgi:peptidoglycan/xylan/chitin deacetylase (PgdA/CDA1 family)